MTTRVPGRLHLPESVERLLVEGSLRSRRENSALRGRTVVVVGAGIAGLFTALALTSRGAEAVLYDARRVVGGRVLTLRPGELSRDGCVIGGLPPGQFVEAGATRVHPHHVSTRWLHLLGVPVLPFVARNDDALINLASSEEPLVRRQRDWWQDLRELSTSPDIQTNYPSVLGTDGVTALSTRRTVDQLAMVGDPTVPVKPGVGDASVGSLVASRSARDMLADLSSLKSASFGRVAGGTDHLIGAAVSRLPRGCVHASHVLVELDIGANDVQLTFQTPDGPACTRAEFAVIAIPPHQLAKVDGNLSSEVRLALRVPKPRPAVKVFLSYASRWWERRLGIYGGTSYPSDPVNRLSYPSDGWGQDSGGVLTAFSVTANARALDELDDNERHSRVVDAVAALHPGIADAAQPLSVSSFSWANTAHIEGGWVNWPGYGHPAYHLLRRGLGRVQLAGDWLDPLTAWMAGAVSSTFLPLNNLEKEQ